ncbi:hypothetical protein AAFF_G00103480 [Aldrovandia affinis]|uniref:SCA7 domain-containing protein n=1 Tax=Aldrovandia affinis TaxID=143900 RepID=A0AAD7WB21_9TELE|nr:hypothetical protein AAFF_G00103480 [Aldrovandia affinis]
MRGSVLNILFYPPPPTERRHSSSNKPPSFPLPALVSRRNGSSKILKPAKEKLLLQERPYTLLQHRVLHHKIMFPAVKVEKIPLKVPDASVKLVHAPSPAGSVSSSLKPSLNCPSIPKAPHLSPGQIPVSSLDRKQDDSTGSKRQLHNKLSEHNADLHCGVLDLATWKPCTRSLTCKTHSLNQRRAVLGRRNCFDTLLVEHKSKAREKELQHGTEPSQHTLPLRDPHPCPSRIGHYSHPISHDSSTSDAKPSAPSKPKPHNLSLLRQNSYPTQLGGNGHAQGDPFLLQGLPHHSVSDGTSRLSSDEWENEEREESMEKLGCYYSGYPPHPAANTSHSMPHKTSPNSLPLSHYNTSTTGFLSHSNAGDADVQMSSSSPAVSSPMYSQSFDSKSVLSYGTTLSVREDHPSYSTQPRQVPSLASSRPLKTRPSTKAFRSREPSATISLSSGKKRKNSSPLSVYPMHPTKSSSSSSSVSSTLKKNCALYCGGSGTMYLPSLTILSSHSVGLNSAAGWTNSFSLKHNQSGRGPPSGSPAEPIKRMSVVMNSSDSTLSLGPFLHQASEHQLVGTNSHRHGHMHASLDCRLEGKRRKGPHASSGRCPGRPLKVAKLPAVNNIHGKHGRTIPGT